MSSDHKVLPREDCVLRYLLDARAQAAADTVFVVLQDGSTLGYGEFRRRVRIAAHGLADLGVRRGDHVLVRLPNCLEGLVTWFAVNYLGAVYVPANTAYRGRLLEHVLDLSDARVCVAHRDLLARLTDVDRARLRDVVVVHHDGATVDGLDVHPFEVLEGSDDSLPDLDAPIEPWDTHAIIFTSGTTGPSKGVLQSYMHVSSYRNGYPLARPEDRHLVTLPMFHVGGTIPVYVSLLLGASFALMESFSTDQFWQTIHRTQSSTAILLGVMAGFLMKQPDPPAEMARSLRWISVVPLDEDAIAFGRRFGVDVITGFNMTEVSSPIVSEVNPTLVGAAGRPRPGIECRIVDAHDCEVEVGEVGELVVRAARPWTMNHGYHKNPQATADAWRNG